MIFAENEAKKSKATSPTTARRLYADDGQTARLTKSGGSPELDVSSHSDICKQAKDVNLPIISGGKIHLHMGSGPFLLTVSSSHEKARISVHLRSVAPQCVRSPTHLQHKADTEEVHWKNLSA